MPIKFSPSDPLGACSNCATAKDSSEYYSTPIDGLSEYRNCTTCGSSLIDTGNWDNPDGDISELEDDILTLQQQLEQAYTNRDYAINTYGAFWRWTAKEIKDEKERV